MINPTITNKKPEELNFWVLSDNHNGATVDELKDACTQIDSEEWEFALHLGDVMNPDSDGDTAYNNYLAQYSTLSSHALDQIYHLPGNHDRTKASDPAGADFYFKKHCSPIPGDNSNYNLQPYTPVGTYQNYTISVGNVIILMLGDDNSGDPPGGESGLGSGSFNFRASGNITTTQWNWLKDTVAANHDKIVIVCSHQTIKDTTIGSGHTEFRKALWQDATIDNSLTQDVDDAIRRGYIAYINNTEGNFEQGNGDSDTTDEIKTWIEANGQYIDLWLHGHYHFRLGETWAGKGRYSNKYNTNFFLASIMNSKLAGVNQDSLEVKSCFVQIKGSTMKLKTYVHYDPNSLIPTGYYAPEEIEIKLKRNFYR